MTTRTGTLLIAVVLGLLLAVPMFAGSKAGRQIKRGKAAFDRSYDNDDSDDDDDDDDDDNGKPHKIPELDPGVAGSAAVLVIGGTLALVGRRRRTPKA